ncbi:helix-turn-helix domain-containing protein [Pectinatus frisingensis]|uniref:helix-turn-helix domain-containing protein n=1 Tax=Pectinatus frisingensis TaxID=865 RepID=UPI0018C5164E
MSNTIGDRINIIIEDAKLKKVQFAQILNIDQSYVSRLIKGKGVPSPRLIENICEKFNINDKWLSDGLGDMYRPAEENILNDPSLDVTDREILNSYIRMTPSQRQFIKNWIKNIAVTINGNGNDSGHQLTNKEESKDGNWKQRELKAYAKELDAEEKGLSVSGNIDDSSKKRA